MDLGNILGRFLLTKTQGKVLKKKASYIDISRVHVQVCLVVFESRFMAHNAGYRRH